MASSSKENEDSVYTLVTDLCNKTAAKYNARSRVTPTKLAAKMRTHAYEIILKKSSKEVHCTKGDPILNLLSYYFSVHRTIKNVAEYKRSVELKKIISRIRQSDLREQKDDIYKVLRLLVALSDSVKEDYSVELFQNPFSFGMLDAMLPKPPREIFGSPQPYPYFPSHVFELPYSLKHEVHRLANSKAYLYTDYTVQSFESRSCLSDLKTHLSPISVPSWSSTRPSLFPYTAASVAQFSRLSVPRDLVIPRSSLPTLTITEKVTPTIEEVKEVEEVFRAKTNAESVDIWEVAAQIDRDIPDDLWEIVSKMPPITDRPLIASSSREMSLWHKLHEGQMKELTIISEKQFIRHVMYLIIGIETTSFLYSEETKSFYMKENLALECISKEHLKGYVTVLLSIGTYYRTLFKFAFNQSLNDHFHNKGLVYESAREVMRRYLLQFRLKATELNDKFPNKPGDEDGSNYPTLLQIIYHMEPLKYEIKTVVSIYKLIEPDKESTIPLGAELMSYLFTEISMVTHKKTAHILFNSLFSICKVYFKFIEKFIFDGELDDRYNEFFIRKDSTYVNTRSKKYWDKGFHISQSLAVPEFLRPLAKFILLCGKSLRLLKHCNPSEPIVLLISSDHPSIQCCASFATLERSQAALDVYRTRCLFVSGEPVTFQQILLKREAERKAFTEMASIKQAETMEKIVAERKRLAQLIIAEKQHSLRVLEAAMLEAKEAKQKAKQRERNRFRLQREADKAAEEVDSKIKDDERNKIMEYYSKLNQQVEKSKIHTEWKIKRLELDEKRMQLLSTEERNLRKEKFELEHKINEEMMSTSTLSLDDRSDAEQSIGNHEIGNTETEKKKEEVEKKEPIKAKPSMLSALYNAAKNVFSSSEDKHIDNKKDLDSQGNIVPKDCENNTQTTSSHVIGSNLNENYDNIQFLKSREEALKNKKKVLSHEFGLSPGDRISVDEENNFPEPILTDAKRNRKKMLHVYFSSDVQVNKKSSEPVTEAHKEAIENKKKVMGHEYNLPIDLVPKNDPANVAQEEAVRNRDKILGSDEVKPLEIKTSAKRSGLTLNLKPYNEISSDDPKLDSDALTPREFIPRLDLETPTTAEVPLEGALTAEVLTPLTDNQTLEIEDTPRDSQKSYLNSEGFDFSIIQDTVDSIMEDTQPSPISSPTKSDIEVIGTRLSVVNFLDGSYSLENFDPFGVKDMKRFSNDYFSSRMDLAMTTSCYTHPSIIMEEVKKKPYANIFSAHFGPEEENEEISSDNIATLTACLQRSVMLPLTYQLEVVNNSILTYFLVNLDMYEHMKSLKDYFFLMDGEFSKCICQNLFTKLDKTLNPHELLNFVTLHGILDKALGSSITRVHKFSENVSFVITETPLSFQHSSPDVLQCLSLTYAVSWPLNIILSTEALQRYARVFQFLIKMRRIFWVLREDFETLKLSMKLSRQHSKKFIKSPHYTAIQVYRHNMTSMMRALDNYIVSTCILSSWREYENDLQKARTLDDLYECHVVYIKKVLFRCLLNNRSMPIMKLLNDIFTVILKFSRVLKTGEWLQQQPSGYFTHSNFAQLQELYNLFEKLGKYLQKVVNKLIECGYQRHLAELLSMVNLNGYYDLNKSKDNTSIQST